MKTEWVALLVAAPLSTCAAVAVYSPLAEKLGVVARMNFRTLHGRIVPRGAGISVGLVFTICIWIAGAASLLNWPLVLAFGIGSPLAAVSGFIDDVREMRATPKLLIHMALAVLLLALLYRPFLALELARLPALVRYALMMVLFFLPLWLINMYNFIDGIDGLAITGAIFVTGAAALLLWLDSGNRQLILVFTLVCAAATGFLFHNLPPARVFMGDAGSIFFGFTLAALLLVTTMTGAMTIWTWIVLLSYFIADTTTTTISRMFLVRRWYGVHRSHAYQNLARVLQSHARVTYGVVAFNMLWALPLALWSTVSPQNGVFAASLALAPGIVWTLRFGPRYSSD